MNRKGVCQGCTSHSGKIMNYSVMPQTYKLLHEKLIILCLVDITVCDTKSSKYFVFCRRYSAESHLRLGINGKLRSVPTHKDFRGPLGLPAC